MLKERARKEVKERVRAGENKVQAICSLRYKNTLFCLVEEKSAAERLCTAEESVACNFNAKHSSTATCLRQQGLSQVALTGTVCEPACGSS